MPKRKLIYGVHSGRFGNQLLRYAHLAAAARRFPDVTMVHLPLIKYSRFLDCPVTLNACGRSFLVESFTRLSRCELLLEETRFRGLVPRLTKCLFALWRDLGRAAFFSPPKGEELDLAAILSEEHRTVLLSGWGFQAWSLLQEEAQSVREIMRLRSSLIHESTRFMADLRTRYTTVVALFVRRGDYATWRNGRYCYSMDAYARWAQELRLRYGATETAVVITSADPGVSALAEREPFFLSPGCSVLQGSFANAFASLTLADVIASPPSTFSGMAAFMADRPLLLLRSERASVFSEPPLEESIFSMRADDNGKHALGYAP